MNKVICFLKSKLKNANCLLASFISEINQAIKWYKMRRVMIVIIVQS